MVRIKSLVMAAAGCALTAVALQAQTGTGTLLQVGTNPNVGCWSLAADGSGAECGYASPYFGQFRNLTNLSGVPTWQLPAGGYGPSSAFGPTTDIFCVDFFHNISTGQMVDVYLTNLGADPGDVGSFTRSGSLTAYLEAAWLSQQLPVVGLNTTAATAISGAIWQIMAEQPLYLQIAGGWYNDYVNGSDHSGSIDYWTQLAMQNWGSVSPNEWVVVTPTDFRTGGAQEFITQVTPEPATLVLMGSGLLIMMLGAGAVRRFTA